MPSPCVLLDVHMSRQPGKGSRLYCKACDAYHAHGSAFFQQIDHNPRGYTTEKVPQPESWWLPGTVDEAATVDRASVHRLPE